MFINNRFNMDYILNNDIREGSYYLPDTNTISILKIFNEYNPILEGERLLLKCKLSPPIQTGQLWYGSQCRHCRINKDIPYYHTTWEDDDENDYGHGDYLFLCKECVHLSKSYQMIGNLIINPNGIVKYLLNR